MGLRPARNYEFLLGDGLMRLLATAGDDLDKYCIGLNEMNIHGPNGEGWTSDLLAAELVRLELVGRSEPGQSVHGAMPQDRPYVTQPIAPMPKTVDDLLETVLMDLWYLVARTSDVSDRPVFLRRLSRNLVLWRDQQGRLQVLEDYCPHRGAPLSMGEVINGEISCPYHGIRLNGSGEVTAVPPTHDCPMVGKTKVKVYSHREFAGAIWVYFTEERDAVPPEPVFPEEVSSPDWTGFLFMAEWNCNWQITLDNRVDPIHGSFLHGGTFTLSDGRKDAELQIRPTKHGFETSRDNQKGVNIDWHAVEFHPGNILWVRTEIPYPNAVGGGFFRINGHPTPIDHDRTLVWFYRSRSLTGWKRDMWRFLYRNRLEAHAFDVVEQDRKLLERIPLAARQREDLIRTDIALTRMRRMLRQEAERQLLAFAGNPAEE